VCVSSSIFPVTGRSSRAVARGTGDQSSNEPAQYGAAPDEGKLPGAFVLCTVARRGDDEAGSRTNRCADRSAGDEAHQRGRWTPQPALSDVTSRVANY